MRLTLATRKSKLALAQSRAFAERLRAAHDGLEVTELQLTTSGDRFAQERLQDIGGKGLFVKELEEALYDGRADFAVHSIKDVPAALAPGLALGCIPEREDPRDVLVSKGDRRLAELPAGARVGTSSMRRALSLTAARSDLEIVALRGNVDTRMKKVEDGELDAVVLALAGLRRLGLADRASETLSVEVSLPAVGQGALGIECREGDERVTAILGALAHRETALAVAAERAFMAAVEGSCRLPIAAHAMRSSDSELELRAFVADPDGSRIRRGSRRAPFPDTAEAAERLGADLGRELA